MTLEFVSIHSGTFCENFEVMLEENSTYRRTTMKIFRVILTLFILIFPASWSVALAQQINAPRPNGAPSAIAPESQQDIDPAAVSGSTIYVPRNLWPREHREE